MMLVRSILLCEDPYSPTRVYSPEIREMLAACAGFDKTKDYKKEDLLKDPAAFADVEYVFSTWGMTTLNEEEIKPLLPGL